MRVLHVLPPASGGMLRHLKCLVAGLTDVEPFCVAVPGAGLEALRAMDRAPCAPLPLPNRATLSALLRASLVTATASRRWRPDLIHGHGYRGMLVAGVASCLARRPFLFTAHTLPNELGRGFWRLAGPLARRARAAACVSQAIQRGLAERLALPPAGSLSRALNSGMLRVIYNGIEPGPPPGPRVPLPADLGLPTARPVVITAARLAPQKGIAHLLDAWARLAPTFPEGILLLAGDGPLRPELEAQATVLGIGSSVRLLGFREDMDALLRAADLAVVPSLAEGQSIFTLEAMARGVPVVATHVGGLPEMVREGRTGLLVPPADPPALATAMARLLNDQELASAMAREARVLVEREWTVARMLAGYRDLYREVWHTVKQS
ncbi:MAG TPA: glycosyltransferase family 4 protein [Armatimonadota bacterium]|nr:glycosyltransferase family 4 protein [Armatimonadota bacterium]HOM83782.1 glycosyltransferase family 4 protein [Armatimonadota bacterium]HPO73625.1 glycosyltransferase family 4 protein [Armatimonadota bacterium]